LEHQLAERDEKHPIQKGIHIDPISEWKSSVVILRPGCFQQYAIGWMPGMSLSGQGYAAIHMFHLGQKSGDLSHLSPASPVAMSP